MADVAFKKLIGLEIDFLSMNFIDINAFCCINIFTFLFIENITDFALYNKLIGHM